jgi:hypothetical protein
LHSSGSDLGHAVAERVLERAAGVSDVAPVPVGPPVHVLVVHTGRSANLRWSAGGTARRERFHAGEAPPPADRHRPGGADTAEMDALKVFAEGPCEDAVVPYTPAP